MKLSKLEADGREIGVRTVHGEDYISITDIAKYRNADHAFIVIANWLRNYSTLSFLGLWEQIHNPTFKPIEFDRFKSQAGEFVHIISATMDSIHKCNRVNF